MVQFMTLLNQFGTLIKCAPNKVGVSEGDAASNDVKGDAFVNLPVQANIFFLPPKSSPTYTAMVYNIEKCAHILKLTFQAISLSSQNPAMLITWSRFLRIIADFKRLAVLILGMIKDGFSPLVKCGNSHIFKDLDELKKKIMNEGSNAVAKHLSLTRQVATTAPTEQQGDVLLSTIQLLTKEVLLVFQELMKTPADDAGVKASDDAYPPDLFNVKISEYMAKFGTLFRFEKILKLMLKLKKIVLHSCRTVNDIKAVDGSIRQVILLIFYLETLLWIKEDFNLILSGPKLYI